METFRWRSAESGVFRLVTAPQSAKSLVPEPSNSPRSALGSAVLTLTNVFSRRRYDNQMWQAHRQQQTDIPSDFRCPRRTKSAKRPRRSGCSFHDRLRCSVARASTAVVLCWCLLAKSCAGEVRSVSRVYHSACLERGQSYWDYENFRLSSLSWEDVDRYEVNGRLGFGRFSEVMEGIEVDSGRKVVLKVLKPARTYKIKREIRVLQASYVRRLIFHLIVSDNTRMIQ